MLKRKIYDRIAEWKSEPGHKALVIMGQRQVGKTYIVREFAKTNYAHFVEINFTLDEDAKLAFSGNLRVDDIVNGLSAFYNPSDFVPGETLLFFDEIQDYAPAWTSLKAFVEDGRYDVIASGSRLGLEINVDRKNHRKLLPTGYQHIIEMKPLDFEEYLWAFSITDKQINAVVEALRNRSQVNPALDRRFNELFKDYLITGGMPEVVSAFAEDRDVSKAHRLLRDLLLMCHQDINRYNTGVDKVKTAECFDSIPRQLSQTNKKFMYSRIDNDGSRKSAEKYLGNLLWIKYSGLGLCCYGLTQPALPLTANIIPDTFRLYMSDTGLLTEQYGISAAAAVRRGDAAYNCGALLENQIAVCLDQCGYALHYYRKNDGPSKMELDFVIESNTGLIIIEVKSGKDRDAPSIRKVAKFYEVGSRIVLENCQYYSDEDGLEHFPLYSAAFFNKIFNQP